MKSLFIQLLLLVIPLLALGLPYGSLEDLYAPEYDYDEDNEVSEEGDLMKAPGFVSETINLVVNEGETIRLPCIVTRLQGFVLLWKKDDNIITVGDQILGNADSRYYLEAKENGNNLMISLAEPGDEGDFVCQVSAFKPTQIHHSVKIRVRPSIQTSPVNSLTVEEGEEARLYCRVVAGNPKPNLKWRRKGGIMPTGDEEIMGEVIIFESVTRHHEGTYECVTEDDFGFEPITREVQLHVKYAPVIEQEQTYIKTEAGEEIHVTCVVHAYPEPQVEWRKDGQPIDEHSNGFVINRSGDRHNLILLVVNKEFFGDYSCRAQNKIGVATKSAHVSGEYESFSELSSVRPQTYPKLDIRTFYLESLGESDIVPITQEQEMKKSKEEIENLKGLRIFSYLKQLRNRINLKRVKDVNSENFRKTISESQESVDDNQEVYKGPQNLGVTDKTDDKEMTKSFRGSFSDLSDLNEIENLEEKKTRTEHGEKNTEDIGWGWYSKETYPNVLEKGTDISDGLSADTIIEGNEEDYDNEQDSLNNIEKKEVSMLNADVQTTSAELTNSYRGSFSQHSDLDEIARLEDGEKAHISDDNTLVDAKDGYYSSPRYLDISEGISQHQTTSKFVSVQTKEVDGLIDQSKYHRDKETADDTKIVNTEVKVEDQTSMPKNTNSYRGSMSQHVDLDEIEASENDMQRKEGQEDHHIINHHTSPRYLDISSEDSIGDSDATKAKEMDEDKESSGEEGELLDETRIIVNNQDIQKHVDVAKDKQTLNGDGFSRSEIYNGQIEDPESHQKPVPGDMYLTTSIVTENIGETNLENKSPYEKPYIITQLPKEHIMTGKRKYSEEDDEEITERTNMIENVRPFLIHTREEEFEVKVHKDEPQMVPLHFPKDKQIIEETTEYQDENIPPLIIQATQGSHTLIDEQLEEGETDGELTHPIITHMQVEASQFKQTDTEGEVNEEHSKELNIDEQVEDEYETRIAEDEIYITTEDVIGHEASDEYTSTVEADAEYLELNKAIEMSVESVDLDESTTENNETEEQIKDEDTIILSVADTMDDDQDEYDEGNHLKHSQVQAVFETFDKVEDLEITEDSLDPKVQTDIVEELGETEMKGKIKIESEKTKAEETGESKVTNENIKDSIQTDIHIETVGEDEETELPKQEEYDEDKSQETTESEDEAEEVGDKRQDTTQEKTEAETDKKDGSENQYEAVDNDWEKESEDSHEINSKVLIKDAENEYVDYSYAEIAARTKTTGTKYGDNKMPAKSIRKKKPKKAIPWLKKFKFVMVGNKVVMVLRKAV